MSNRPPSETTDSPRDDRFRALADSDRRAVLRLVHGKSPAGISKDDLAFQLAAVTSDKRLAAVTDADHRRALADLHHRILPALSDASLLEEADDGTITAADDRAFAAPPVADVVSRRTVSSDDEELDALFESLASARRRTILTVLADQYHPIATETLARDVAAREAGVRERDVPEGDVDSVLVSLVHVHLPLLSDAGLVGYDADSSLVTYEGHPALRVEWLDADDETTETPVDATDGVDDPSRSDVRTIEGREAIVATGQSLCERAEDELFLLFSTTGLLEEGCFRRIQDAIDRGVDVYLGSRDPRVREIVTQRAPEVEVWDPQADWFELPPDGESVGRLVFADRNAVMLGTLGRSAPGDEFSETAILGEGPRNGLVVLMRRMLGSRLDSTAPPDEECNSQFPP